MLPSNLKALCYQIKRYTYGFQGSRTGSGGPPFIFMWASEIYFWADWMYPNMREPVLEQNNRRAE